MTISLDSQLPRAGVITYDVAACLGCRECEVACSLGHTGECNPELSRIRIDLDDFTPGYPDIRVCKQCDWPACLLACAARWPEQPMRIDARTGARYVDPALCHACGACVAACPLTPERPVIFQQPERPRIAFQCDLCRDRPEGPLCVAVCPGQALNYVPAEERR